MPPLAVEHADTGQDEPELQKKIREMLRGGTRLVWVVRLSGARRVEVYARGVAMRVASPGDLLDAPGMLKNAVPVEALYDRREAHRLTLRNLLQREGYQSLDEVRQDGVKIGREDGVKIGREDGIKLGRDEGRLEEARAALRQVLALRDLVPTAEDDARIDACTELEELRRWLAAAMAASSAAEALQ